MEGQVQETNIFLRVAWNLIEMEFYVNTLNM